MAIQRQETIRYVAICDGCGYTVNHRHYYKRDAEKTIRAAGWKIKNGKHYCPSCAVKMLARDREEGNS